MSDKFSSESSSDDAHRPSHDENLARSGDRFADKPLTDKIGNNLKRLYDDVLTEDVPDDFLALLAKADKTAN